MVCRLLYIAGTLTGKEQHSGGPFYGRVADPTGVFEIRKMRPDAGLQTAISGIEVPAFVTVLGQARVMTDGENPSPYIELVEIRGAERMIRDLWIVRTAELTFERLSLMRDAIGSGTGSDPFVRAISEFQMTQSALGSLAEMACRALEHVVDPSEKEATDSRVKEKVLSIIRESAGKKGMPLEELIRLAEKSGIDETAVRQSVMTLLEEDECYQPAREVYKPL
jgi:RPA family protein